MLVALNKICRFNHCTSKPIYYNLTRFNSSQPPSSSHKDVTDGDQKSNPQLDVFRQNASKWWSGKEFSLLRSMNELRVPFIVDGLRPKQMIESHILDVGCGGGILSEPLARLGAKVLGIDPVFESINQAQLHAQLDESLGQRLKYRNCNIEDLTAQQEHIEAYDGLVLSEVLEHIEDVEQFLFHCTKVLKPNGSLFITTINQTPLSWLGVIFFGEYVLKQLPKGTHSYDLFVSVKGLKVMLERMGYHIRLVNGFMYEPISGNFYWTPTTLTHYALQAIKTTPMAKNLNYEQKRHAPKSKKLGRPKRPLDDVEMMTVIPIDIYRKRADAIVDEFKTHIESGLSTRGNTTSIENLKVCLDGLNEPLELRDIAQISMKGTNLIVINLSTMPEAIKPTLKALSEMNDTLSPQVEVNNIFVPIPRVTQEHRQKLINAAKQVATRSREKIRALFSEFSSMAKSQKGVSTDLVHDTVENIKFDMDRRVQEIDSMLKLKSDQLLNKQ